MLAYAMHFPCISKPCKVSIYVMRLYEKLLYNPMMYINSEKAKEMIYVCWKETEMVKN